MSSSLDGNKVEQNNVTSNSDCAAKQIELYLQTLKPIEITLETSGCGRAWTNIQAGVNSSKHFPQTRLGKHYSRQKSSDTADQKKKTLVTFKTGGRTSKRVCLLDGKAVAPTTSVPEAQILKAK